MVNSQLRLLDTISLSQSPSLCLPLSLSHAQTAEESALQRSNIRHVIREREKKKIRCRRRRWWFSSVTFCSTRLSPSRSERDGSNCCLSNKTKKVNKEASCNISDLQIAWKWNLMVSMTFPNKPHFVSILNKLIFCSSEKLHSAGLEHKTNPGLK